MDEEKRGPDLALEAEAVVLFSTLKKGCRIQSRDDMPEAAGAVGGWFVTYKRELIPGGIQPIAGFSRLDRGDILPVALIPAEFIVACFRVFGEPGPHPGLVIDFPGRGHTLLIAFPVEVLGPHAIL